MANLRISTQNYFYHSQSFHNPATVSFDFALDKITSTLDRDRRKDEFESFGLTIASQLRKIPELHAIQLMSSIQQQITQLSFFK